MSHSTENDAPTLRHEKTCAYYPLVFKPGSGNRVCSCPGRVIPPVMGDDR